MLDAIIADLTNPTYWLIVLALTAIGLFNKLIYYEAGQRGGESALNKIHGYTQERADELHHLYDRWGSPLLLLASVPVIGSVTTVLAGADGVALPVLVVFVVISNLVRNWLIVILAGGIAQLLT